MKVASALLVTGLAAQQAVATWDTSAKGYPNPSTADNACSSEQHAGFDFGKVPTGALTGYGGISFDGGANKGWSCASSFRKRDGNSKRTGGGACAKTSVSKSQPASFSCGEQQKGGMSVTHMQVSTEFPCDVDMHYTMPDNSVCKQKASCGNDVTTITNSQCGGAQSVQIYLANSTQQKDTCDFGIHNIGFNCNSASPSTSITPSTSPVTKPSSVTQPSPSPTKPSSYVATQPTGSSSQTKPTSPSSQPAGYTSPSSQPAGSSMQTKPAVSTSTGPSGNMSSTAPGYSSSTAPGYSSPIAPGTSPVQTKPGQSTTVPSTATSGVPSAGYSPSKSSPVSASIPASSSPSSSPSAPAPPVGVPSVLPRCMNSWLVLESECADNTDISCYCKLPDFTDKVIDCVSSWGSSDDIQMALSYLVGICASFVPQNPGLITHCPSSVSFGPGPSVPSVSPNSSAPVQSGVPSVSKPSPVIPGQSAPAQSAPGQSGVPYVSSKASSVVPGSTGAATAPTQSAPGQTGPKSTGPAPSYGQTSAATAPVQSAPKSSAGYGQTNAATSAQAATSPAVTSAAQVPVTTISFTATVTVPCTNNGVPSSSIKVQPTQVTVPQVAFSTPAGGATAGATAPAVNLVAGSAPATAPGYAPATSNAAAATTAKAPYGNPNAAPTASAFGTITIPAGKNGSTAAPTNTPLQGAASVVSFSSFATVLVGAIVAVLAL